VTPLGHEALARVTSLTRRQAGEARAERTCPDYRSSIGVRSPTTGGIMAKQLHAEGERKCPVCAAAMTVTKEGADQGRRVRGPRGLARQGRARRELAGLTARESGPLTALGAQPRIPAMERERHERGVRAGAKRRVDRELTWSQGPGSNTVTKAARQS